MNYSKLAIQVIILLMMIFCLFHMPYNYYQITKFAAFVGFIAIAYFDYKDKFFYTIPISLAGAILFNPLFKMTFKRPVWQEIDKWVIGVLLVWIFFELIIWLSGKKIRKAT